MLAEFLIGALAYHPGFNTELAQRFENKIDRSGRLISPPMIGARLTEFESDIYRSGSFFAGENSVGGGIAGGAFSAGWAPSRYARLGVAAGLYYQAPGPFKDRELDAPHPFMPLLGTELILTYPFDRTGWSASLNNLISPLLTTHYLSFGYHL